MIRGAALASQNIILNAVADSNCERDAATVAIRTGDVVEYTAGDLRVHMAAGMQLPLLMGATGRLLATRAGLSRAQVRAAFKRLRWKQPLSFEDYWRQAEVAAKRGWAMDDGFFDAGITSVAAPIPDPKAAMTYAFGATMFRCQHDESALAMMTEEMQKLAPTLSRAIC